MPSEKPARTMKLSSRILQRSSTTFHEVDGDLIPRRERFQRVCESAAFRFAGLLMSGAVVIQFGIFADYDLDIGETVADEVLDSIFAAFFIVELFVRFLVYIKPMHFFTAPNEWKWNVLDLFLVCLRVLRGWILPCVLNAHEMRIWRVVRMLDMLRVVRLLYSVEQIRVTLSALSDASIKTVPVFALLLLTMYCEAVLFTLIFKKSENLANLQILGKADYFENRFGSVMWSMMTSLQVAVFDDVGSLIRAASEVSVPLSIFLFLCVVVNAFLMLNILVGFIYDLVSETTEQAAAEAARRRIDATFKDIDKDMSGEITEAEYDAQAKPLLRRQGIDGGVVENAFAIIDSDGNGKLDKAEFAQYLMKMLRDPNSEEVIKVMTELAAAEADLLALKEMQLTNRIPPDLNLDEEVVPSGIRRTSLFLTSKIHPSRPGM